MQVRRQALVHSVLLGFHFIFIVQTGGVCKGNTVAQKSYLKICWIPENILNAETFFLVCCASNYCAVHRQEKVLKKQTSVDDHHAVKIGSTSVQTSGYRTRSILRQRVFQLCWCASVVPQLFPLSFSLHHGLCTHPEGCGSAFRVALSPGLMRLICCAGGLGQHSRLSFLISSQRVRSSSSWHIGELLFLFFGLLTYLPSCIIYTLHL